jgi:hypothetical protein
MHTTTITKADRAALENLWGDAGAWAADSWTRLNADHFGGRLVYHGVVWGLTPHGRGLGHTNSESMRITLHPALLDPRDRAWGMRDRLGVRFAADVLLHEMVHVALLTVGVANDEREGQHNTDEWCEQIMRITPDLSLPAIKAAPVKTRRINGGVVRQALDGHLSRSEIARWPYSIRPASYYANDQLMRVDI